MNVLPTVNNCVIDEFGAVPDEINRFLSETVQAQTKNYERHKSSHDKCPSQTVSYIHTKTFCCKSVNMLMF